MGEPEVFQSVAEPLQMWLASKMAEEKVEITTTIGSLCTSLRVRESVVACLLISWILQLFLVRKPFGFGVGQTDSKYPQNSD